MISPFVVVMLVATQEATPPAPEPAPAPPTEEAPSPPVEEAAPPTEPLAPATTPAPPAPPDTPPPAKNDGDFYAEGNLGYYLAQYGADYVGIAAAGTLYGIGATNFLPPGPALIGPSIDLDNPDVNVIMDPRLDRVIGNPILTEKAPNISIPIVIGSEILVVAAADLAIKQDLHRTHNVALGAVEAWLSAGLLTEIGKLTFGRLRPDFRERYIRAACAGVVDKPDAIDCSTLPDDGFVVDRDFLYDGMKSFPSGHASSTFATATFFTLVIGSEYVLNEGYPDWVAPLGALSAGALVATAGYITATRVGDYRHHIEDVTAGALLGVGCGTAAYFLHFDQNGKARRRGIAVAPMPLEGGAGVALIGGL
jgi:membrane-associated phospholipid phosphatase